ncbi:MAG: hypothetical protein AABY83_10930 [Pseudomonadota bacterium]
MPITFSLNVPPVAAAQACVQGNRDSSDILRLAVAQMHCALEEGHPHVDTLSKAITLMHEGVGQLRLINTPGSRPETLAVHDALSNQLGLAVLAIQFYDRLVQRLGHVRHSLELLEDTLSSDDQSSQRWQQTLAAIRATYTMEDEKRVFEIILAGGSAADVTALPPTPEAAPDDNSIELF